MPNRVSTEKQLKNIISFRVSDQELQILERMRGKRTTKLSSVLRQLVKQFCDSHDSAIHQMGRGNRVCNG